jgi:hypothetical protein
VQQLDAYGTAIVHTREGSTSGFGHDMMSPAGTVMINSSSAPASGYQDALRMAATEASSHAGGRSSAAPSPGSAYMAALAVASGEAQGALLLPEFMLHVYVTVMKKSSPAPASGDPGCAAHGCHRSQ